LKLIDAHPALFLLSRCFTIPKLLFTLRSAPCFRLPNKLSEIDSSIRCGASEILNVDFDDTGWIQATLPLRQGGLGLRAVSDVALPAYAASLHGSRPLVESILQKTPECFLSHEMDSVTASWTEAGHTLPLKPAAQKNWDSISSAERLAALQQKSDQRRRACLEAAKQPHSGDWLSAIPSLATGTYLDGDCLRYAVALRTGSRVCEPYRCRCGRIADIHGHHPLSCAKSAGRFPRHAALNDVVKRALDSAGMYSVLEPVGLDRGDGRRPDGMTTFPYRCGRSLIWDATCTDTFSPNVLALSATEPGHAARLAEEKKIAKYSSLTTRYIFTPIAVETSGVIGPRTLSFLKELGKIISRRTGDPRESLWLFQRVSVAIVRGNFICLAAH
jgi:hypothetical protein